MNLKLTLIHYSGYKMKYYFEEHELEALKNFRSTKGSKLLTGSAFYTLAGYNEYNTPNMGLMQKLGKFKVDIDPKYGITGTIVEDFLRDNFVNGNSWVESMRYYTADEVKEMKYDAYQDDDLFGGIPDGIIYTTKGKILWEAKTATASKNNLQKWSNGKVPMNYLRQALLYASLEDMQAIVFTAVLLGRGMYDFGEALDYDLFMQSVNKYKSLQESEVFNLTKVPEDFAYVINRPIKVTPDLDDMLLNTAQRAINFVEEAIENGYIELDPVKDRELIKQLEEEEC